MCGGARTHPVINFENIERFINEVMNEDSRIGVSHGSYNPQQTTRSPGSNFMCAFISDQDQKPVIDAMGWGINLFPRYVSWQTPIEGITLKNGFKRLINTQRCLVFISSFKEGKHYFSANEGQILVLGGIYRAQKDNLSEYQVSIVTQPMISKYSHIHDRCPIILFGQAMIRLWLRGERFDERLFVQPDILTEYIKLHDGVSSIAGPLLFDDAINRRAEAIIDDDIIIDIDTDSDGDIDIKMESDPVDKVPPAICA